MLTFRAGAALSTGSATKMADHLMTQTLPATAQDLALYYQRGMTYQDGMWQPGGAIIARADSHAVTAAGIQRDGSADVGAGVAEAGPVPASDDPRAGDVVRPGMIPEPRRDMDPRLADLLAIDLTRPVTRDEIAHLLAGQRADGARITGKQYQRGTEALADVFGLDPMRVPTRAELANILAGQRADGTPLPVDPAMQAAAPTAMPVKQIAVTEALDAAGVRYQKRGNRVRLQASWRGGEGWTVSVNASTGAWKDFATGDVGGFASLRQHLSLGAAREIGTIDPEVAAAQAIKQDEARQATARRVWRDATDGAGEMVAPVFKGSAGVKSRKRAEWRAQVEATDVWRAIGRRYFERRGLDADWLLPQVKFASLHGKYDATEIAAGAAVAMVTPMYGLDEAGRIRLTGVQRTYLNEAGEKSGRKMLGQAGSWWLAPPAASGQAALPIAGHARMMLVGEGFETVASVVQATGHAGVVGYNAGGVVAWAGKYRGSEPIGFLVDRDHPKIYGGRQVGLAGQRAAAAAIEVIRAAGNEAVYLLPPASVAGGRKGADWADALTEGTAETLRAALTQAAASSEADLALVPQIPTAGSAPAPGAGTAPATAPETGAPNDPQAPLHRDLIRFLKAMGVEDPRALDATARENILAGRLANGDEQTAREWQRAITKSRTPIGYVDYTFSADKSVSLAWAFAPTEAERNLIAQAHRDAVHAAMQVVAETVGQARMGKGGRDGAEKGAIGWITFDHYTARPTLEIARPGPDGRMETELVTMKVAGDPQLHTHVAVPNVVLTPGGRVGSLDMLQMHDRIHEWGALYQAYLAQNLRALGAAVTLDETLGSARLTAVPDAVRTAFSKRTRDALADARSYAKETGANWDRMSPDERIMLLKGGAFASRSAKADDLSDFAGWQRQAERLGYQHKSVLDPLNPKAELSAEQRIDVAYRAGARILGRQFEHRAVLGEADARVAAARGLIASGLSGAADIDTVRAAFNERGVTDTWSEVSGGLFAIRPQTALIEVALVRDDPAVEGATMTETRLTTQAQLDQEQRVIELARKHAGYAQGLLTPPAIQRGIAATDLDLTGAHGQAQRRVIDHLGMGGRFAVAIGAAGSGKTTLLKPLVAAWHEQGADIHGISLGWRQARDLRESGLRIADPIRRRNPVPPKAWGEVSGQAAIPRHLRDGSSNSHRDSVAAVSVFINRVKSGRLVLSHGSVVVIDELGTIGTRQLAELLTLQDQYQFRMVAIGDPKQCQSIEAGSVIRLLETALGKIPSIETTVRQTNPRAREIAGLLRAGKGAEALAMKYQDKTAEIVSGGVSEIVERAAALWHERRQANADRPRYSISISTPTNEDARAIGMAIRARLQASGELGRDETVLTATDPNSHADYDLPLAIGDRVRLFARTQASLTGGQSGAIGDNGSILEVRAIQRDGLILRNDKGNEGLVAWEALTDQRSGRVRLTYGYAMTTNTAQGATTTEHIFVTPAGSRMTDGFKSYVSGSRHRERDYWLTSEGAERQEIVGRRPLGDPRPIHEHDIWANWGRNIMRRPEILNATDIVAQADRVRRGTARSFMTGKELHETTAQTTDRREELQRKFQHTNIRAAAPEINTMSRDFADHQRQTQGTIERLTAARDVVRRAVADRISRARPLLDRARGVARERIDAIMRRHEAERAARVAQERERQEAAAKASRLVLKLVPEQKPDDFPAPRRGPRMGM